MKPERLALLKALYDHRLAHPEHPGLSYNELLKGSTLNYSQLEFAMWLLAGKGLVSKSDTGGSASISVAGAELIEQQEAPNGQ